MEDKSCWEEQTKINKLNNSFNLIVLKKQIKFEEEVNKTIRTFGLCLTIIGLWMMFISFLLINKL